MFDFDEVKRVCKKHNWTYEEYIRRMLLVKEAESCLMRPEANTLGSSIQGENQAIAAGLRLPILA